MSSVKDLQVPVYGLFLNMINYIKLTNKIKKNHHKTNFRYLYSGKYLLHHYI